MIECRGIAINKNLCNLNGLVVSFSHIRAIGAYHIDMLAWANPSTFQYRFGCHCAGKDDVSSPHRHFEIRFDLGSCFYCKYLRTHCASVPDTEFCIRKTRPKSLDQRSAHGACTYNQNFAGATRRQRQGGHQTISCGLPFRN